MTPVRRPTPEDCLEATRLALTGIAREDELESILRALHPLHPKNNTFPGEVLLELAADALVASGVSRSAPLEYEGIRERYLPECEFRGRTDHRKSHYALSAVVMIRAGLQPDLLGEVMWWSSDDLWVFAFYGLVIYLRAAAERTGRSVPELAEAVALRHGVDLAGPDPEPRRPSRSAPPHKVPTPGQGGRFQGAVDATDQFRLILYTLNWLI